MDVKKYIEQDLSDSFDEALRSITETEGYIISRDEIDEIINSFELSLNKLADLPPDEQKNEISRLQSDFPQIIQKIKKHCHKYVQATAYVFSDSDRKVLMSEEWTYDYDFSDEVKDEFFVQ